MQPEIQTIPEKYLIGMHITLSLSDDRTSELWRTFMPRRAEVPNKLNADFYSVQDYGDLDIATFTTESRFNRWAAVEVSGHETIPDGMQPFTIAGGTYAVFVHKGPAAAFAQTWGYIFQEWLPASDYEVDQRAHFEILGPDYRPDDPNAQEQVWIPVKPRT